MNCESCTSAMLMTAPVNALRDPDIEMHCRDCPSCSRAATRILTATQELARELDRMRPAVDARTVSIVARMVRTFQGTPWVSRAIVSEIVLVLAIVAVFFSARVFSSVRAEVFRLAKAPVRDEVVALSCLSPEQAIGLAARSLEGPRVVASPLPASTHSIAIRGTDVDRAHVVEMIGIVDRGCDKSRK